MLVRGLLSLQSVAMRDSVAGAVRPGDATSNETRVGQSILPGLVLGANSHETLGWLEYFTWSCDVLLIPLNWRDHYCVSVHDMSSSLYIILIIVFPV